MPPLRSPLLATPFRLFFLMATLYAAGVMGGWIPVFLGEVGWTGALPATVWHGHEMVFGYTAAALAGFLLTAVANWTQIPPWSGSPLAALGLLWLAGRVAVNLSGWLPLGMVAAVDILFLPALAAMLAQPVMATGNRRQYVFVVLLAALAAGNMLVHLEVLGLLRNGGHLGLVFGVNVVMAVITVIGGRIIPMFTSNALRMRGDGVPLRSRLWVERLVLPVLVLMAALDLLDEAGPMAGLAALAAAAVHGVRLAGWRSSRTLGQPLVWSLHLGYGWLVLGLALKGLAVWVPAIPPSAALHALTAGVIGTLTLGVMTRVSLAHTGRMLHPGPFALAAYALVSLSALLRVAGPLLLPGSGPGLMAVSGVLWSAAFLAFGWGYVRILLSPRADGQPG